jgi:spermidine/putrescine transport system substrate-binding protein
MPDYPLYDFIYAAQYLGIPDWYRLSNAQIEECKKALIAQKKLLKGYWLSDADVINLWTNGEILYAAASTAGVVSTLRSDGFPVARTVPEEGCPGFINAAYISVGASDAAVGAAYKFFDYLLGPIFGERIGLQGRYATATTLGQDKLPDDIKEEIFLTRVNKLAELKVKMMIPPTDPTTGELNYDVWVRAWSEVKAA